MARILKSLITGFSMLLLFSIVWTVVSQLNDLCDEYSIVWEKRPRMTKWIASVALHHSWQRWFSLPLVGIGFAWLEWLAQAPTLSWLTRMMFAWAFIAVLAAMLPFMSGNQIHMPPQFNGSNCIIPALSFLPLLFAIGQHRSSRLAP